MMAKRYHLLATALLVSWPHSHSDTAASDDVRSLLARVSLESVSFARYLLGDECLSVKATSNLVGSENQSTYLQLKFDFHNGMMLFLIDSKKSETVLGINDKYCFEILRENNNENWTLVDYAFASGPEIDTQELGLSMSLPRPTLAMYLDDLSGLRGIDEVLIGAHFLLASEAVRLVSSSENDGILDVSYTRTNGEGDDSPRMIRGTVGFSKSDHLLPVFLNELLDSDTGVKRKFIERNYTIDTPGQLERVTTIESFESGKSTSLSTLTEELNVLSMEKKDFTLSSFGLPEPAQLVSQEGRFTTWLIVTNIGFIFFLLYFLLRRKIVADSR